MARPKSKIDPKTLENAETELKKLAHSKLSLQLKAIIASSDNTVQEVAKIFKVADRTVFRWVDRFTESGIDGLRDRPKGHLSSKLSQEHLNEIENWILSGKNAAGQSICWTLGRLQNEVETTFEISIGITALWNYLGKMNLVLRKPRPEHASADKQLQSEFKKNRRKS
jgi:transposase